MEDYVSAIVASLAFVLSILNFFHSRRSLFVDTISKQRVDWITNIRVTVREFIYAYIDGDDANDLLKKKYAVELWLNSKSTEHAKLLGLLDQCMMGDKNQKEANIQALIEETQHLLNLNWGKMKNEAKYKSKT